MRNRLSAQTTLALMLALSVVMIEVSAMVSIVSVGHFQNKNDSIAATKALTLVDSGVEEALYQLHWDSTYTGGVITTPDGSATITVTDAGGDYRDIRVVSDGAEVLRRFQARILLDPVVENPLKEYGVFGGDDIEVDGENTVFRGAFRANDNLRIYGDAIVQGNAYLSGEGSSSNSRLRNNAELVDDPTTPEVEGNIYSVDDIFIENNSVIHGDAVTSKNVRIFGSATVLGSIIQDDTLEVTAVPIPEFDFAAAKVAAQTGSKYFTSTTAFLNYLNLNGGSLSGGVHYIETNQTLTFAYGGSFDITGTIVSEGPIHVQSTNYNHNPDSTLPVLVSMKDIQITDSNSCNCQANITGAIFALDDIIIDRDQHTGAGYSATIDGILWAGDNLILKNNVMFTYNQGIAEDVTGFNFDLGPGGQASSYLVNIQDWSIE